MISLFNFYIDYEGATGFTILGVGNEDAPQAGLLIVNYDHRAKCWGFDVCWMSLLFD